MPRDGGDAEQVLAAFLHEGVDVMALATDLQRAGTESFVASWRNLLECLAAKSGALANPQLS
jgi:transaldolase